MSTDASGVSGAFNLPPGLTTIFSERADDNARIFEYEVLIRAGHVTLFNLKPNR
jgi:hypothetical protein